MLNCELTRFYHDRPEQSVTFPSVSVAHAKEASANAIKAKNMPADPACYFILCCDSETVARFDLLGNEIEEGPCVECEVCGADADAASIAWTGEDVCAACAADWDDDHARSYGPRDEITRLRYARR